MNMLTLIPIAATALLSIAPTYGGGEACRAQAAAEAAAKAASAPASAPVQSIELAICLDTSGSMNGLLDSARARIWDIVSDLATATPTPTLRVALVTFGNDGHSPENGWTNVDSDLVEDLDGVSAKLFALTTNGGTEYVGRAVDRATRALKWTPGEQTLKIVIVAGNESADQDQEVKYQDACKRAIGAGIMVNSIYCGADNDALVEAWREVARLADGRSASIDQNSATVAIATPFDAELVALNAKLNATYIPYGAQGDWGCRNQVEQDSNAAGLASSVAAQRCVAKSGSTYANGHWDLVDACKQADFKLQDVDAKTLPEAMRAMTLDERRAYIAARAAEREAIQKSVQDVNVKRAQFVAAETAKLGDTSKSFERAIRDAVRAQASARGLKFPADPMAGATTTASPASPAPASPASGG